MALANISSSVHRRQIVAHIGDEPSRKTCEPAFGEMRGDGEVRLTA
jgi:hypothetical protein